MRSRPRTPNLTSSVLSILLLVAIAAFAILVALQLRADTPPRFDVADPEGVECPEGEGTPACFSFTVTNLGNRPSLVECTVSADAGRATFLNDSPVLASSDLFEPGIAVELIVKVDQGDQDTVTQPTLVCRAV
jgi:uncharacterized protein (DUF58 family)